MKKLMVFGISFVCLLFVFISFINLSSAIRINEIELNPNSSDSGKEWIELYSNEHINMSEWYLENNDNDTFILDFAFQNYIVINFSSQWLDNSNEKIILKNQSHDIIHETPLLEDSDNDDKTWQYCDNSWKKADATPNLENNCEQESCSPDCDNKECGDDGCGGSCGECDSGYECSGGGECVEDEDDEISIDMDWDEDDIINGKEFEIDIGLENLKSEDYDIKVWIEDGGDIISETYHEQENKWLSGTYYIIELVSGPGEETKDIKLRIDEDYEDFSGDAEIKARIRRSDTEDTKASKNQDIEVLEKEDEDSSENSYDNEKNENHLEISKNNQQEMQEQKEEDNGVIKLGNKNSLEEYDIDEILYESSSEKMKKYSIYFLSGLLMVIIIILIKKI
jgi:hypothetical protein